MPNTAAKSIDLNERKGREILLQSEGPVCLIIKASLRPVGDLDRFQPAGYPEIGHVIYDAPRGNHCTEKVCIVDSSASMANHLEAVCMDGPACELCADLAGLPYVRCVTDAKRGAPSEADSLENIVCTSLTEGHRLASDYFLDGLINRQWIPEKKEGKKDKQETIPAHWDGSAFREKLRTEFSIIEVAKDKTYFIPPRTWWSIYKTVFKYDPNSLIHGIMFAREQIKISRFLAAHLEAFGASRVGRSGVKFDRLGKTTSGQPIFSVDEETASEIRATFILDLALLRSYGRDNNGLSSTQKQLLLDMALWKIGRLLARPFRFRTGCFLTKEKVTLSTESQKETEIDFPIIDMKSAIKGCKFNGHTLTSVYYPSEKLFKPTGDTEATADGDMAALAASAD
jgi:CRISPR-associated protein Csb1